jgi:formylglycine-generating enzyme required for sulfatase activity
MEFVWAPPGTLSVKVGCQVGQDCPEGAPVKVIDVRDGFWMGRTEVTVKQFRAFAKQTGYVTVAEKQHYKFTWRKPGFKQADNHPVVFLLDRDALAYAQWAGVDLPTIVEWLYAARAGATTRYYFGDQMDSRYAWHRENSPVGTHPVARRLPNAWGLYDIIGNAYEWTKLDEPCDRALGNPAGGSWTRCGERIAYDLPTPPQKCPPFESVYDDDRGFRCVRRVTTGPP